MENASKALLIAGSVLIAIVLIEEAVNRGAKQMENDRGRIHKKRRCIIRRKSGADKMGCEVFRIGLLVLGLHTA